MRLLHFADAHLGFRQFERIDSAGRNIREQDVMRTFRSFIDQAIALEPEIIVFGGDLFHVVRPGNATIVDALNEFTRLSRALPTTVIVIVAGNHDMPRSRDSESILQIFAPLGINVIDWEAKRLSFADLDLSILAVPDAPGVVRPALTPDPTAKYSVLLLHGEVHGMLPKGIRGNSSSEISTDELHVTEWNYAALGHWHVCREIHPNCWYSGSIDYTSTDPWSEMRAEADAGFTGKGFIERDLATGAHTFHALPPSRRLIELESFSAHEMDAMDVDTEIARLVDGCAGGIDDQVVRLVITDIPKEVARELDQAAIKSYKKRALNFQPVFRRGEAVAIGDALAAARRQIKPLNQMVAELFADRWADHPDRDALVRLSEQYMGEAEEKLAGKAATATIATDDEVAAA